MDIGDVDVFNTWILPIIKPICLADPESLARYVVVLLKKSNPKPDLRSYCIQNLSIFIDGSKIKVEDFVDMVLDAVQKKKYFPDGGKGATAKDLVPVKHSKQERHGRHRPPSKHSPRSRSRSPVTNKYESGHSSRKSSSNKDETGETHVRKNVSQSSEARSRSRSERDCLRSKSPHSHGTGSTNENVSQAIPAESKKSDPSNAKICPSFEKEGYCLVGDSCTFSHPGFLQVEEKDIQTIAATYQAAAAAQLLQHDPSSNFTPQKSADFSQQVLNTSPKNAHISPMLASYLQLGFQQIAAAAAIEQQQQQQQQFLTTPQDISLYNSPYNASTQMQSTLPDIADGNEAGEPASVPVVVSSRFGGFHRRQDQSNLRHVRRSAESYGARKFAPGDNRYDRPPISASQLDSEMDELAKTHAASRLDSAYSPDISGTTGNDSVVSKPFTGYNRPYNRGRGGSRGSFHRGGRIARNGNGGGRSGLDSTNSVLEIRKVPPQLNVIGSLHEHFSNFGPISNIQVNYDNDPEAALVTFINHNDALDAYKCAQPLFNNRFIRVFWHHREAIPASSVELKPAKVELDANKSLEEATATSTTQQQQPPVNKPPPRAKLRIDHSSDEKAKVTEAQNDLAKRRRLLLANYIEMRKTLSEKLKASTTEATKAELTATLKTVEDKIGSLKAELLPGLARAEAVAKQKTSDNAVQQASGEAAGQVVSPDTAAKTGQKQGTIADRASFIVDRRPKQLLVQTVTGLDATSLRAHFGLFCSVDGVELSSAGFVVTFASRRDAEVAKARGLMFCGQQISLAWHQPTFFETATLNLAQKTQQASMPKQGATITAESERSLFDDGDSEEEQTAAIS